MGGKVDNRITNGFAFTCIGCEVLFGNRSGIGESSFNALDFGDGGGELVKARDKFLIAVAIGSCKDAGIGLSFAILLEEDIGDEVIDAILLD